MSQKILKGEVVEKIPDSPFPADPGNGLYLLTEDGQGYALVSANMAAQMPINVLHQQSRDDFEAYLGKKIKVEGYLSGNVIFGAIVTE